MPRIEPAPYDNAKAVTANRGGAERRDGGPGAKRGAARGFDAVATDVRNVGQLGWPAIDFLRLDVEGHEVDVLTGFAGTLDSSRAPGVIQFEYGMTYIPARHTLHEVYGKLGSRYAIGRLCPDGVDFKEYDAVDDHFRMGNYIAVRRDTNLSTKLSRF